MRIGTSLSGPTVAMAVGLAIVAIPAATAQLSCTSESDSRSLRDGGANELVGDIVLRCSGGPTTATGFDVPTFQVVVTTPKPISSQIFEPLESDDSGWGEALLLVDEPASNEQRPCAPENAEEQCEAKAGDNYSNVYQGKQILPNAILFDRVPIDPPGPDGERVVRITNLRLDVSQYPEDDPREITVLVQVFDGIGSGIAIEPKQVEVGSVRTTLSFAVRTAIDSPSPDGAFVLAPDGVPRDNPQAFATFNVKFSEAFEDAFKRRNIGVTSVDNNFLVAQPNPGADYSTESGLFNPAYPAVRGLNRAGLADTGTRLQLVLKNVPKDLVIWVGIRDAEAGTTGYDPDRPKAQLVHTDNNGAGNFGAASEHHIPGFSAMFQHPEGLTAIWEVIRADPDQVDEFSFVIAVTRQGAEPSLGVVEARGELAPRVPGPFEGELSVPAFQIRTEESIAFSIDTSIPDSVLTSVSAASFQARVAPDSIASGFAEELSDETMAAADLLPTELAGIRLELVDSAGFTADARLFSISPTQVNYWVDPRTRVGPAALNVFRAGERIATGALTVERVAPGLFAANGNGMGAPAGVLLRVQNGVSLNEDLLEFDAGTGLWGSKAIDLGPDGDLVFLTLFGTGLRGRSELSVVRVTIGGVPIPVTFAGPQGQFSGLDQLNIGPLPKRLAGSGDVSIVVTVEGIPANVLSLRFL